MCSSWFFPLLGYLGVETNLLSRNRVPTLLLIILMGSHLCGKAGSPVSFWGKEVKRDASILVKGESLSSVMWMESQRKQTQRHMSPSHTHEDLVFKNSQPVTDSPLGDTTALFQNVIHTCSFPWSCSWDCSFLGRTKGQFAFQELFALLFF